MLEYKVEGVIGLPGVNTEYSVSSTARKMKFEGNFINLNVCQWVKIIAFVRQNCA